MIDLFLALMLCLLFLWRRLQLEAERAVLADKALAEAARAACVSFVRAYATYPAALKKIFHVKGLHLGHIAKSFALRETPATLPQQKKGGGGGGASKGKDKKGKGKGGEAADGKDGKGRGAGDSRKRAHSMLRRMAADEFASGSTSTGPVPAAKAAPRKKQRRM